VAIAPDRNRLQMNRDDGAGLRRGCGNFCDERVRPSFLAISCAALFSGQQCMPESLRNDFTATPLLLMVLASKLRMGSGLRLIHLDKIPACVGRPQRSLGYHAEIPSGVSCVSEIGGQHAILPRLVAQLAR
jgi:hypothetical protein